MSILAGLVSRRREQDLERATDALRHALSRRADDVARLIELRSPRATFLKLDLGAFGAAGHTQEATALAAVAGEPLLEPLAGPGRRTQDLSELIRACATGAQAATLRRARGTFAGAVYETGRHRLTLFTDRFGVRPLYVAQTDDYIVFATALRIIEDCGLVPLTLDMRGVAEITALGAPLADRTPYRGVRLLRPSEIMSVAAGSEVQRYHEWKDPSRWLSSSEAVAPAFDAFIDAVRIRVGNAPRAAAFLSGGLDSRCVVAALRVLGREVYTYNLSPTNSLDQQLGRAFAAAAGTHHVEIARVAPGVSLDSQVRTTLAAASAHLPSDERPALIWSGDGGSVGVGYVYISPEIVDAMRRGDETHAVELFLKHQGTARIPRLLTRAAAAQIGDAVEQGIRDELARIDTADPVRRLYLFLLHNDQHRHLAEHFEDLDLNRLEFQLPFFDPVFLDAVGSVAPEQALRHQFYNAWLSAFPATVSAVPWQAYPGHVPCPLPVPEGVRAQWDASTLRERRRRQRRRLIAAAAAALTYRPFPGHIMRRSALLIAAVAHGLGMRDQEYVIRAAAVYHRYWAQCTRGRVPG